MNRNLVIEINLKFFRQNNKLYNLIVIQIFIITQYPIHDKKITKENTKQVLHL